MEKSGHTAVKEDGCNMQDRLGHSSSETPDTLENLKLLWNSIAQGTKITLVNYSKNCKIWLKVS